MFKEISLQLINFIYVFVLATVYFLKRKYNFIESTVYKMLLLLTMLILMVDITDAYITASDVTNNLINFIRGFYSIGLFAWLALYSTYVLLCKNEKKYESYKDLTEDHPYINLWVVFVIIFFIVMVFLKMMIGTINYYGNEVDIVYIIGLIASIFILIVLIATNRRLDGYKKWSVLVSTFILTISFFIQIYSPEVAIVSSGICLITLFQYFTLENPDLKYVDELNALKVRAEGASAAKTSFLANMSHEIRTPMNVIIGLSENLLNSDVPPSVREDIKNITEAGSVLLEIVNNILDITKIEEGKSHLHSNPYSLADTLAKISRMIQNSLTESTVKFDLVVNGNIPTTLMGDEFKVYQILMNLLSNAVKYTKKGSIKLVVDSVISGNKDILTFKVIDTGMGIKKTDMDKLFQQFERLDQEQSTIQGSGLGLVITKKLADIIGGKISVESVYQEGSTFTFYIEQEIINREQVDFEGYKVQKAEIEYFDGRRFEILLVDDNQLNLKVAEKLLKRYNLNVTSATTGLECLNYTKSKKYDLIFLDHMMPEMDGITTLRNLKKRASGFDTPVVVLTANAIGGSKKMYLNEGFCDYLTKPIDQMELDRILREQLKIGNNTSDYKPVTFSQL